MKAGNVRKFGERSPQQVGQEEKSDRHMEHTRESSDQANTEKFIKEISDHAARRTEAYPGGATMPDLSDTHGEDMAKLIEAAGAADADMTALEAVAEYMATVYEDVRKVKYQRGFPLETIYGVPGGHGKTHYQLVVNCTDLRLEEQDGVEVIVVDKGNTINLATDLPGLVSAIQVIFTQAGLGEAAEHLKPLPATTTEDIVQALESKDTCKRLQNMSSVVVVGQR
eukprot:gene29716-37043_t